MNIGYKLLWIEDSENYYTSTVGMIKNLVRSNNMIPEITYYEHFDDFLNTELDDYDIEIFNLYDQFLIDYSLSGMSGDEIIRNLRNRNIHTDIVFYSSNFKDMQQKLREGDQLDGVFLADREDLTMAIDKVIKKNLKREYNIANIRGLIMDSTSDFDYICRITTLDMFNKLPQDRKEFIEQKAKEYVNDAKRKSTENFSTLDKKDGFDFITKAVNSVHYVMDNGDRYKLMSIILSEFDFHVGTDESFAEDYYAKIIKPRNKLAHNKLYYGECRKKLFIAKERQSFECDKSCENCAAIYDIESCENLRKLLFEYYFIFDSVNDEVVNFEEIKISPHESL